MAYKFANPNPLCKLVDDCVPRALSIALGVDWEEAYMQLCVLGIMHGDMPNANHVWADLLESKGFKRHIVPDTCPNCYTVRQFTNDHRKGTYVLATGTHVVASIDGDYFDTFDSGDYVPMFYWEKT